MNTMTLEHFHDFYYLEALRANISMAVSSRPELSFRKAVTMLESDVNDAFDELTKSMALHIALYIWAAALGEARYAGSECVMALDNIDGLGRSSVYKMATDYCITQDNIDTLKSIFSQEWNDNGFGGEKWLECVEGLDLYGKVSDATFIDHTVDLEHNGGNIFTKTTTENIWFKTHGNMNADDLRSFLNIKFSEDILQYHYRGSVSRKVYTLITRYSNIIEKCECLDHYYGLRPRLEWLGEFSVEWGDEILTTNNDGWGGKHGVNCQNCGDMVDREYSIYHNDDWYCESCFNDLFEICGKCQEFYDKDELVDAAEHPTYHYLCEFCAQKEGFTVCYECNEYHMDCITPEDDDDCYCKGCAEKYYCEECDKFFYHTEEHKTEEHGMEGIVLKKEAKPQTGWVFNYRKTTMCYIYHTDKNEKVVCNFYTNEEFPGITILNLESMTKTGKWKYSRKHDWSVTASNCGLSCLNSKTSNSLEKAFDLAQIMKDTGFDWTKAEKDNIPGEVKSYILEKSKTL